MEIQVIVTGNPFLTVKCRTLRLILPSLNMKKAFLLINHLFFSSRTLLSSVKVKKDGFNVNSTSLSELIKYFGAVMTTLHVQKYRQVCRLTASAKPTPTILYRRSMVNVKTNKLAKWSLQIFSSTITRVVTHTSI